MCQQTLKIQSHEYRRVALCLDPRVGLWGHPGTIPVGLLWVDVCCRGGFSCCFDLDGRHL
jgi:hypothetical protein